MQSAAAAAVACCLRVCYDVGQLLLTAKHNKDECRSLGIAVICIESFLKHIPFEGVSIVGVKVLDALSEALTRAQSLITRVTNTGPLVSLLTASVIRDEFLRINRDLTSTFQILASGENLLNIADSRSELIQIQCQLSRTKTFFAKQEQQGERLRDAAAVAVEQHTPDELLHRALLDQLEQYSEVAQLTPQQLLEELQALQMAAMYGGEPKDDGEHQEGHIMQLKSSKGKALGQHTEEFLVQQLCAALSPKASQAGPLTPSAAADVPDGYSCPISQEVMSNPVILVETGQSYEAANIQRWLAAHNTCPATGKMLTSKQLVQNHNLKKSIHGWASQHGILLLSPKAVTSPAGTSHVSLLVQPDTADAGRYDDSQEDSLDQAAAGTSSAAAALEATSSTTDSGRSPGVATQQAAATSESFTASRSLSSGPLAAAASGNASPPIRYPSRASTAAPSEEGLLLQTAAPSSTAGQGQTGNHFTPATPASAATKAPAFHSIKLRSLRCTRTSWAVSLVALVLIAAGGVGSGVGVYMVRRRSQSQQQTSLEPGTGVVGAESPTVIPLPAVSPSPTSPSPATTSPSRTTPSPPSRSTSSPTVSLPTVSATSTPAPSVSSEEGDCPGVRTLRVVGTTSGGRVWGSGPYTRDSDYNVAAVHAGLVARGEMKAIMVTPAGYMSNFTGSTANGVTTGSWRSPWCGVNLSPISGNAGR